MSVKLSSVLLIIALLCSLTVPAHEGHPAHHHNQEMLNDIDSISRQPYLLANLKKIQTRGRDYLKESLDHAVADKSNRQIYLRYLRVVSNLVDWPESEKTKAREIYRTLIKEEPTVQVIQGIALLGNHNTRHELTELMERHPEFRDACEKAMRDLARHQRVDANVFSDSRDQREQRVLMLALAQSNHANQVELAKVMASTDEQDARTALSLARNNELGLRAVLLKVLSDMLQHVPDESEARDEVIAFARGQVASGDKYTRRYAKMILEQETGETRFAREAKHDANRLKNGSEKSPAVERGNDSRTMILCMILTVACVAGVLFVLLKSNART